MVAVAEPGQLQSCRYMLSLVCNCGLDDGVNGGAGILGTSW